MKGETCWLLSVEAESCISHLGQQVVLLSGLPELGWASSPLSNCCGKGMDGRCLAVRDAHQRPREARASGRRRRPGWEFGVSGLLTCPILLCGLVHIMTSPGLS